MEAAALSVKAMDRRVTWGVPVALFVLAVVPFLPCLGNEFVNWDDDVIFLENPSLGNLGTAQLCWGIAALLGQAAPPPGGEAGTLTAFQPLSWWLFDAQVALFGLSPRAVHLVSLLLHAACAMLLYRLSLDLVRRAQPGLDASHPRLIPLGAGLAVALYAMHPLRTEVVAWASAQPYLPCTLFLLLSVLAYVRACPDGGRVKVAPFALSFLCFVLALLAKPLVVGLPLILLLLDFYPLCRLQGCIYPRRTLARICLEKLPFVVASVAAMTSAVHMRAGLVALEQDGILGRVTQVGHGAWFYLDKTLAPRALSYLYAAPLPTPWQEVGYLGTTLAVVAITVVLLLRVRRTPGLLVGWLTMLLLLAPMSGIFRTNDYVVADRYSYVPCLAAVILLGAGLCRPLQRCLASPRPQVLGAVVLGALILGVLGCLSWRQTLTWHDSLTLRAHGIRHGAAQSALANGTLGSMLLADNRHQEAAVYLARAVELAPEFPLARKLLGMALLRERCYRQAIPHLRCAVATLAQDAQVHYLLGFALAHLGDLHEARSCLAEAASRQPDDAEIRRLHLVVAGQLRQIGSHTGNPP